MENRAPLSLIKLIDSHCHLDFAAFDGDRDQLLNSLPDKGIVATVVPAIGAQNWQAVLNLADCYPTVYPALGIHPMFLDSASESHIEDLAVLLAAHRSRVVAIGECGLDMSLNNIELQRFYFVEQLRLAQQFELPVIIHHRKSHHLIVPFLKKYRPPKGGIIHAFSGSLEQALQYIDLGFKLGIGGTISYDRAQKTRDTVAKLPLESLVLETDAPDMPIHGRQGHRNSPQYLGEIFAVLSVLREEPRAEMAAQLIDNTMDILNINKQQ